MKAERAGTDARMRPFRDPNVVPPTGDPYEALAEFGVTFESSMADIHKAGLEAQRRGQLTPERRDAWARLRNPERRLCVDYFYYQPEAPAETLDHGRPSPSEPSAPDLWLPAVEPPAPELLAAAVELPEPEPPPPLAPAGPPPPVDADLWQLLAEGWTPAPEPLPALTPARSFLDVEDEP